MLRCGVAPRALACGSRGEPVFLRAPMRAEFAALCHARALFMHAFAARKRPLEFGGLKTACDVSTGPIFGCVSLRRLIPVPPQPAQSIAVAGSLKNALRHSRRASACRTLATRHSSITSPNHVQPNRKRSARGLIHTGRHETRARRCILPKRCGTRFATA